MTKGNWFLRSTVGTASIGKIAAGGGEPIDQRIEVDAKYGGGTINYALFQEVAGEEDRGNNAGLEAMDAVIKGVVDEVKRREGQGRGPAPTLDEKAGIIIAQSRADGEAFPLAMYKGLGYTAWYMLPFVPNADIAINGQAEVFTHKNLVGMGTVDDVHRVSAGLMAFGEGTLIVAGGLRAPVAADASIAFEAEMAWGARLEPLAGRAPMPNRVANINLDLLGNASPRALVPEIDAGLNLTMARGRGMRFNFVDKMDAGEFRRLVASVAKNGFRDPYVKFVSHGGENYIILGSNRVRAANKLGLQNNIFLEEVRLPYGDLQFNTIDDVIRTWAENLGHP